MTVFYHKKKYGLTSFASLFQTVAFVFDEVPTPFDESTYLELWFCRCRPLIKQTNIAIKATKSSTSAHPSHYMNIELDCSHGNRRDRTS